MLRQAATIDAGLPSAAQHTTERRNPKITGPIVPAGVSDLHLVASGWCCYAAKALLGLPLRAGGPGSRRSAPAAPSAQNDPIRHIATINRQGNSSVQ